MKRFVADEEKQAPSDTSADDHPLDVSRRNLLLGAGAAAIVGAQVTSAAAQMGAPPVGYGTAGMGQLKEMFPTTYDPAYIQNAVMAFVRTNLYAAQRPFLPMIDETLSKENALPYDLGGCSMTTGPQIRRRGSRSSCKASKSAGRRTAASGFIFPR